MFVAWLTAPCVEVSLFPVPELVSSGRLEMGFRADEAGLKNISDVLVSVCVCPKAESLSTFSASFSDQSVQGVIFFCAPTLRTKARTNTSVIAIFFITGLRFQNYDN